MQIGPFQVLYEYRPVAGYEQRMGDHTISNRPGSSLHHPVLIVQKEFEQSIKTLLIIPDPMHDTAALCPGMFFEYFFPEIESGQALL